MRIKIISWFAVAVRVVDVHFVSNTILEKESSKYYAQYLYPWIIMIMSIALLLSIMRTATATVVVAAILIQQVGMESM